MCSDGTCSNAMGSKREARLSQSGKGATTPHLSVEKAVTGIGFDSSQGH